MPELASESYCQRRANPFSSLVAVVEGAGGRARSLDGRTWQIEVLAHSPRTGLERVPLNPILDVGRMLAASEALTAPVAKALSSLPFPLAPELEPSQLDRSEAVTPGRGCRSNNPEHHRCR